MWVRFVLIFNNIIINNIISVVLSTLIQYFYCVLMCAFFTTKKNSLYFDRIWHLFFSHRSHAHARTHARNTHSAIRRKHNNHSSGFFMQIACFFSVSLNLIIRFTSKSSSSHYMSVCWVCVKCRLSFDFSIFCATILVFLFRLSFGLISENQLR